MNGQNGTAAGSTATQGPPSEPMAGQWLHPAPSLGEHTIDTVAGRILCIADIRGKISKLNDLADRHNAKAIIHTGDFGFYDKDSVERITVRTLRHVVHYSSLIDSTTKEKYFPTQENPKDPSKVPLSLGQLREALLNPSPEQIQDQHGQDFILSEFPKLLRGEISLKVPVYTVWGACEDVHIIEKLRLASENKSVSPNNNKTVKSEYAIPNLTVLSEGVSRLLNIGGIKLRLFGLGGSVVYHKLFDNGEGNATIAGGGGTMWTTALQIGELVDTAQRVYDATETRLLITHASPGREGLLAQLALAIKADYTISGSLHFRYGTSYDDFATQSEPNVFRNKLLLSSKRFREVYDIVRTQVENAIDNQQKKLLKLAVAVADRVPAENAEEFAWKNSWHWNLPDALFGSLVLDIRDGRLGSEQKSTGFNFAYRLTLNNKSSHPKEAQGSAQTQAQAPSSTPAPSQSQFQSQSQAGPSKKPIHLPFHQQRVLSNNHHNNTQRSQEPSKQGYLAGTKPEQSQDASASSQQQQSSAPPASGGDITGAASSIHAPQAGSTFGPRGPPTPRDFEQLAKTAFKKPVGAGRGRGSPSLTDHGRQQSASTGRSSPTEQNTSDKKDAENGQQPSSTSNETNREGGSAPVAGQQDGEGNQEIKSNENTQAPANQRRTSGFNQATRGRGNGANWRNAGEETQAEASGNESPSGTPGFRGRGRGRGSYFESARGGAEAGRGRGEGNFRGGRGRPDGPYRGGSFDASRGGRGRGGRGGHAARNASESGGDSGAKPASPAPEKPKTPAPANEGASA